MKIDLYGGGETIIDSDDLALVGPYPWRVNKVGYVIAKFRAEGAIRYLYMHRLLVPDAPIVDHINGDPLDNRRANLRAADKRINSLNRALDAKNRSGRRGVYWNAYHARWEARMKTGAKHMRERFSSFEEAVRRREEWELAALGHTLSDRRLNAQCWPL